MLYSRPVCVLLPVSMAIITIIINDTVVFKDINNNYYYDYYENVTVEFINKL